MSQALVILSTVGNAADAQRIADSLVGQRLAACVSILPGLLSTYRWAGAVQREPELLLVIKTTADRADALRTALVAAHPYDVPEVLVIEATAVHEAYGLWLASSVAQAPG